MPKEPPEIVYLLLSAGYGYNFCVMKRIILFPLLLALIVAGCKKDQKVADLPSQTIGMHQLVVDPSFSWATSGEVLVRIPADINGMVRVTSADGGLVYYKGFQHQNASRDIRISVPNYVTRLAVNGRTSDIVQGVCTPAVPKSAMDFPLSFGSPFVFNTPNSRCPDAVALDDNRFVVTYAIGDFGPCYLKVGTRSGDNITFGPAFQIPGSGWAYYSTGTQLIKAGPEQILVAFKANTGGFVSHISVSGDNFTVNSTIAAGGLCNHPSLALLNSTTFIYSYNSEMGTAGYARLCNISGTTITAGPQLTVPNSSHGMSVHRVDDTRAIFLYRHGGTGKVRACIGSVVGGALVIAPDQEVDPGNCTYPSLEMLDDTRFAVAYQGPAPNRYGLCRIGTVSGTNIAFSTPVTFSDIQTDDVFLLSRDASNIALVYSKLTGGNYSFHYQVGTVTGTSVSFAPGGLFGNYQSVNAALCLFGPNRILATVREHPGPGNGLCYLSNPIIPDTDGDGVGDPDDDYPTDPTRAFDNYFPAADTGTLGFEDLWPGKGDYDFNDVVVDYRFKIVTNASNKVVEIFAGFLLHANGAILDNGFGFNLPDCDPQLTADKISVTGYHHSESYITLNPGGTEAAQDKPTFIVWDNTSSMMPDYTNTVAGYPYLDPVPLTLLITTPGFSFEASAFALPTWNPFIICGMDRGMEVHLADRPPTALANPVHFGMFDDNSIPASGRYYKTLTNLPWAIDIPERFAYPFEKVDITHAHLKFADWAQSSGLLFPDWFQDKPGYRNNSAIYSH